MPKGNLQIWIASEAFWQSPSVHGGTNFYTAVPVRVCGNMLLLTASQPHLRLLPQNQNRSRMVMKRVKPDFKARGLRFCAHHIGPSQPCEISDIAPATRVYESGSSEGSAEPAFDFPQGGSQVAFLIEHTRNSAQEPARNSACI